MMRDLIEALLIFLKYHDSDSPTICEHDELIIAGIDPEEVSARDRERLELLGFFADEDGERFKSFRYGSG